MDTKLYVITAISNPCRYKTRYNLYRDFKKYVEDSGAILVTVEMAYGDRPFEITTENAPFDIQVRSKHEVWHKENLMNIALQRLPQDAKYIAWIDADVRFSRPDWVEETVHQLQHYDVVQMFTNAIDLGPKHEPFGFYEGFAYKYVNSLPMDNKDYHNSHPGYAWAATRWALDHLGGFIDWAILGSADRHMAFAFIGEVEDTFYKELEEGDLKVYFDLLLEWQERAETYIKRNIGYVESTLLHYFHGPKKNRGYSDRWRLLVNNKYNPNVDLKKDIQGVWQLTNKNIKLRDGIRAYFRSRSEDDTSKT